MSFVPTLIATAVVLTVTTGLAFAWFAKRNGWLVDSSPRSVTQSAKFDGFPLNFPTDVGRMVVAPADWQNGGTLDVTLPIGVGLRTAGFFWIFSIFDGLAPEGWKLCMAEGHDGADVKFVLSAEGANLAYVDPDEVQRVVSATMNRYSQLYLPRAITA